MEGVYGVIIRMVRTRRFRLTFGLHGPVRDCGASEGELNDRDGKRRKEVGSHGWTRCLALIHMYRHRLRIAFAQQRREAYMFSACGTRKTAVLLAMTDSQIHMISDFTTEQFEQVQCHNLNGQ